MAKEFGLNAAVLLRHIEFWLAKNEAHQRNFYDGCYWTYCSAEAMAKIFPYLTERQIRYALGKLIKRGILKTGNYSDGECNRTTWYAFGKNYARPNLQNCQMQVTKLSDASDNNVSSYSNTYNNIIISNTDKETDKRENARAKKETQPKHQYGEYNNVLLTDEEYAKLGERLGVQREQYISDLSSYIGSKGASYKSHYITILNWYSRDEKKKKAEKKNTLSDWN